MTISIRNDSVSAVVRGYALDSNHTIVWLELAPQHPKTIGAIWADMVNAQKRWLQIGDMEEGRGLAVRGLGSRYERLTADAPELALGSNAKSRLLRLVAPSALRASDRETFYVFAWPPALSKGEVEMDAASALAAMLERDTRWPVQTGWGAYLLKAGLEDDFIKPLETGGVVPEGYEVQPCNWGGIIANGLRNGHIRISQ